MKFKIAIGVRGKLLATFCLVGLSIAFGGTTVYMTLNDLRQISGESALLSEGMFAANEIDKLFSDANLVGMDIIVDHYENPRAKVGRKGEVLDLENMIKEKKEGWRNHFVNSGFETEFGQVESGLSKLFGGLNGLVSAIDRGETRPEVYAKFDEDIDGGKEEASAHLSEIIKKMSARSAEGQTNTFQRFDTLGETVLQSFGLCLVILLLIGVPLINKLSRAVSMLQERMFEIVKSLGSTSYALDGTSQKLAAASTESSASIQETVSSMAEMSAMLNQTSRNAEMTTMLSREVLDKSENGVKVMQDMSGSMNAISDSSSRLKEIVEIIENISIKTNIINDVVFKTQLLAVNASIEAARAGHHGKGFSVVANEVASLASLSGKASSEIRDLLTTSSTRVQSIIEGTSNSIKDGESSSRRSAEVFGDIAKSVSAITEKIEQIHVATREQETGVSQANSAMNQMNQATSSTNAMAHDNAQLGREVSSLANELSCINRALLYIASGSEETKEEKETRLNDTKKKSAIELILSRKSIGGTHGNVAPDHKPSLHHDASIAEQGKDAVKDSADSDHSPSGGSLVSRFGSMLKQKQDAQVSKPEHEDKKSA
jgi:methyl-accepting chemotaxis protein